jgi:hypothetical protein
MLRLHNPQLSAVDRWIAERGAALSRPEAIRVLIDIALNGGSVARQSISEPTNESARKASRSKSSEMAGREIDRMGDQSATSDERASRKRRLIKGPKEFRSSRVDRPKKA